MLQEQVRIEEARLTKQDPVDMSFFVAEAACRRFKNGKEASFNSAVPNYECICRAILEDVDQCLQKALEVFGEDYVAAGPLQKGAAQELKQAKNKLNEGLETFKKNMTELKGQFDRSANIAEAQKALEKSKEYFPLSGHANGYTFADLRRGRTCTSTCPTTKRPIFPARQIPHRSPFDTGTRVFLRLISSVSSH